MNKNNILILMAVVISILVYNSVLNILDILHLKEELRNQKKDNIELIEKTLKISRATSILMCKQISINEGQYGCINTYNNYDKLFKDIDKSYPEKLDSLFVDIIK